MDRLAIIIKGYSESAGELAIDRRYVRYYNTFLSGVAGGAWDEEEILILEEPTIRRLELLVEQKMPNFVLLILIGHGATKASRQLFKINRTTIIKAGQLALDVDKQLVIVESCRTEIKKIETVDLKDRIPMFRDGGIIRAPITRAKSREIYLTQLDYCSDGLVICHACQTNEEAANFYFSQALLTRSFEWHLQNHNKYFPINQLMEYVSQDVQGITRGKQTPEITGNIGFPFAISKF